MIILQLKLMAFFDEEMPCKLLSSSSSISATTLGGFWPANCCLLQVFNA